jgi:hypothetical protein
MTDKNLASVVGSYRRRGCLPPLQAEGARLNPQRQFILPAATAARERSGDIDKYPARLRGVLLCAGRVRGWSGRGSASRGSSSVGLRGVESTLGRRV